MNIDQITIFELEILASLSAHSSLRNLAREKKLEPPHLSKLIRRLETKLNCSLISRSPKGFLLTPQGLRAAQSARSIVETAQSILDVNQNPAAGRPKIISVATTRFVSTHLMAPVLERLRLSDSNIRFRLMDMSPDEVAPAALKSACEVAVTIGEPRLPRTWETIELGDLTWGLFASQRHPLGRTAKEKEVLAYPFLVPTYWKHDSFEVGDDNCPIPWKRRKKGDESSSVLTALEIVCASPNQLLFAPKIVVKRSLQSAEIKEIHVSGWKTTRRKVFFSSNARAFTKSLEVRFVQTLRETLQ